MSRLEIFLMMFPPAQLALILRETNIKLQQRNATIINRQELLKFFGCLILLTRFEFANRNDLWSTCPQSPYEFTAQFRRFFSRNRFNEIIACLRFSRQIIPPPNTDPSDTPSERIRWSLVDDFVTNFNQYRINRFIPSDSICVDESMSRWYGLGGSWINIGLPHYMAIDRKPDAGCEIQTACCGKSGVMLQLKLVKTNKELDSLEQQRSTTAEQIELQRLQHGTKILLSLVKPWQHSQRLVAADSFFASVHTAETMMHIGLRFIGVVKSATRRY
jgi:Transposase IS4